MRALLFALCTLALVGCKELGVRPAGPFAKNLPVTQQGQPLKTAAPVPDAVTAAKGPAVKAAQPAPPTLLVTPGEVNADNAHALAQKLSNELSTDSKATASAPVTVEVSKLGRVRLP